jgi:hypothetical protein
MSQPRDKINSFFGSLGGAAIPKSAEMPKKSVGNDFTNVNDDFEKASSLAHKLTRSAKEQHEHLGAHHAHHSASWLGMGHPDKERVEEHNELAHHHADRAKEKYEEEMVKE